MRAVWRATRHVVIGSLFAAGIVLMIDKVSTLSGHAARPRVLECQNMHLPKHQHANVPCICVDGAEGIFVDVEHERAWGKLNDLREGFVQLGADRHFTDETGK